MAAPATLGLSTPATLHVSEHENELNDNLYNLKMSSTNELQDNIYNIKINTSNSGRRVRKMLKPLLRLLRRKTINNVKLRKNKINKTTNSQTDNFSEEVDNQNNANESLEQRLLAELRDAEEGAAITVCLDGQMTVVPVVPGQCYVPVHFAHTHAGDFYWTTLPLADSDLCYKERAFSQHQVPEMQVAWTATPNYFFLLGSFYCFNCARGHLIRRFYLSLIEKLNNQKDF